MADGVTPNFALIKPEIDGSLDTWGDKLHANYDVIDAALAKTGGINVNLYNYNAAGIEPPVSGEIRFNNANITIATKIWIAFGTANSVNAGNYLQKELVAGSMIYLQNHDNPANWAHFQITSNMVHKTTYGEWSITFIDQGLSLAVGKVWMNSILGAGSYLSYTKADLWYGAIFGSPSKWSWNDKADGSGDEIASLTSAGNFAVDGTIVAGGAGTFGGNVTSAQSFISTSASVVLGVSPSTNATGTIFLRPNGYADADNQTTIASDGDMVVNGSITAVGPITAQGTVTSNQNFDSVSTSCILSASSGGKIYFRPNGPASATDEMLLETSGDLFVKGNIRVHSSLEDSRGIFAGRGILERAGSTGAYGANWMNFVFVSAGDTRIYSDTTHVGTVPAPSDYRLKREVHPLASMWEQIKALRPVSFIWRKDDDNIEHWGFIAHELQEDLIPGAASGYKDMQGGYQSPDLSAVVAALTSALQEAMKRIEVLEGAR